MRIQRYELLKQAGLCAADAGVPFDVTQPEAWRRGWLMWGTRGNPDTDPIGRVTPSEFRKRSTGEPA